MNRIFAIVKKGVVMAPRVALAGLAIMLFTVGGMPAAAQASVAIDADGKVKAFGDVRLRVETDARTKQAVGSSEQNRTRARYRARFGVAFTANDQWSGKIRLATTSSQNSPHQTFATAGSTADTSFGVDTAFFAYTGVKNLTVVGGKTPLNFWQQNEVFIDDDIHPEALAVVYGVGGLTLNGAYTYLTSPGWDGDQGATAAIYQAVYKGSANDLGYTVAVGGATLDGSGLGLMATQHTMVSAQVKSGPFLVGGDYLVSDASSEDTAYVAQVRFKATDRIGLRLYYYSVETYATLGDGLLTQDNFPSAEASADNFDGYRLQVDFKAGKNTSIDLRYYDTEIITSGLDGQNAETSRLQLNVNVKF
jgi:hypothetical protein